MKFAAPMYQKFNLFYFEYESAKPKKNITFRLDNLMEAYFIVLDDCVWKGLVKYKHSRIKRKNLAKVQIISFFEKNKAAKITLEVPSESKSHYNDLYAMVYDNPHCFASSNHSSFLYDKVIIRRYFRGVGGKYTENVENPCSKAALRDYIAHSTVEEINDYYCRNIECQSRYLTINDVERADVFLSIVKELGKLDGLLKVIPKKYTTNVLNVPNVCNYKNFMNILIMDSIFENINNDERSCAIETIHDNNADQISDSSNWNLIETQYQQPVFELPHRVVSADNSVSQNIFVPPQSYYYYIQDDNNLNFDYEYCYTYDNLGNEYTVNKTADDVFLSENYD